ncbi:MAG: phosphoglucosamine mutase [Porticoccaceae bacterium]|nr:phosphoglucosamine mutase [Porticoccaceae bacterium]|tara:strand:- start:1282 stop:2625 length:1344 start_codon:yes stop_codon:yes gene_type:complete
MKRNFFGTDGIRGRVGKFPITADFVLKLGWAVGRLLNRSSSSKKRVLIGKDTRVSGYMFESALEAGLISAGVEVGMLGPMPTPAIAYLTRALRASAGIVISASHNPYYDNGIKFFGADGYKFSEEVEAEVERILELDQKTMDSDSLGKAYRITDADGRYVEFCKSTLPLGHNLSGLRIVVDCAHGATYSVAPKVFKELGADVIQMGTSPDGFNINSGCGSTDIGALQNEVITSKADLGVALDGDGDRVLMVDHKGVVVDGDELLYVIASHRASKSVGCSGVVGTLMTNMGVEIALRNKRIPFERVKVGDRYVVQRLIKNNWDLGGESSGHILCRDINTSGDGIVGALQVIRALSETGVSLSVAKSSLSKLPQRVINVVAKKDVDLESNPYVIQVLKHAEKELNGCGRVLLRPSGTEPLIRVMVEGESNELVDKLVYEIAEVVRRQVM